MAACVLRGPGGLVGCNVYPEVPDGGWGWLVAGAFFLVEVFTYGIIKSFGVFLQDLTGEFGESNARVSWIISISVFVMTFTAPLASLLTNRFGTQPVVMTGGLLVAMGTITTGFTNSINEMYITTGVVAGLGYCLTFLPTVTLLSQYFLRRRPLVTAVASTGESFSVFALAPAFSALRDVIGWRRTMVVVGVLQGSIIMCGLLLRPIVIQPGAPHSAAETQGLSPKELEALGPEQEPGRGESPSSTDSGVQIIQEKQQSEEEVEGGASCGLPDFSLLREGSFICYSLFGLFATLGFFAPPLYVIELSVSRGVERGRAALMLSTMAVAEVVGRLSVGWALSRRALRDRKLLVLQACVVLLTAVLVAFTLVRDFYGLAACCALYGFFMGTIASTHIPLLAEDDVVGLDRMPSAAGVYVFIQSFAGLAGPPVGGALVDMTGNYGSAFYSCAAGMAVGAVFLGLVKPARRGLPCGKRDPGPSGKQNQARGSPSQTDYLELDVDLDQNQEAQPATTSR